jgi:ABC-type methionine transport system ATPase subunit
MIRFEKFSTGYSDPFSFEIRDGTTCKIIMNSNAERRTLVRMLSGLDRPAAGKIFLFEKDLYSLGDSEYFKIFRRIGMVSAEGGMISNLTVRENISLPSWYHAGRGPQHDRGPAGEYRENTRARHTERPRVFAKGPGAIVIA